MPNLNYLYFFLQVVRVWFCNRRQKGKRLALPMDEESEDNYYEQSPPQMNITPSPIPGQLQDYAAAGCWLPCYP